MSDRDGKGSSFGYTTCWKAEVVVQRDTTSFVGCSYVSRYTELSNGLHVVNIQDRWVPGRGRTVPHKRLQRPKGIEVTDDC